MKSLGDKFKNAVEKKFIYFLKKSVIGLKKDFYKQEVLRMSREILLADLEDYDQYYSHNDEFPSNSLLETDNDKLLFALNSLTSKQLKIVTLIEVYELTEKEVANLLKISQQSVHKTKSSALKKLKTYMYEVKNYDKII